MKRKVMLGIGILALVFLTFGTALPVSTDDSVARVKKTGEELFCER
jgi:hypothetical protein